MAVNIVAMTDEEVSAKYPVDRKMLEAYKQQKFSEERAYYLCECREQDGAGHTGAVAGAAS